MEGQVYQVVEFQHVKPGKGRHLSTKYKNVVGAVVRRSFNPNEKFEQAQLGETICCIFIPTVSCIISWISTYEQRDIQG